jgi:hypothetical protein
MNLYTPITRMRKPLPPEYAVSKCQAVPIKWKSREALLWEQARDLELAKAHFEKMLLKYGHITKANARRYNRKISSITRELECIAERINVCRQAREEEAYESGAEV